MFLPAVKIILFLAVLFSLSTASSASAATQAAVLFDATYNVGPGDTVYGMDVDKDDNIYVGGLVGATFSWSGYHVVKYTPSGSRILIVNLPCDGAYGCYDARFIGPRVDGSGNIYVSGYGAKCGMFCSHWRTVKYDAAGNLVWKIIEDNPISHDKAYGLDVDQSGNAYVTGNTNTRTSGFQSADPSMTTIKYNPSGATSWIVREGIRFGQGYGVAADSSGNVYAAGVAAPVAFQKYDYYTVKYNSSGGKIWGNLYGTADLDDYAQDIAVDQNGNAYVGGYSQNNKGVYVYPNIIKYNSGGSFLGKISEYPVFPMRNLVAGDASGNVYLAARRGSTSGDFRLIKFSPSGSVLWDVSDNRGSSDAAASVAVDSGGQVFMAGLAAGTGNFYFFRYNSTGSLTSESTFSVGDTFGFFKNNNRGQISFGGTSGRGSGNSNFRIIRFADLPLSGSCTVSPNPAQTNQTATWSVAASGGDGTYTYSWSGSDGLSGSDSSVSKAYSTSGSKSANVQINSGGQNANVSCTTLQVNDPLVSGSCSPSPNPTTVNQQVTWSSSVSGGSGSYSYSWSGSDGLSGSTASVQKSYSTPGTKMASVSVTSGTASAAISCSSLSVSSAACSDSVDNDGDGLIDFPSDPQCASALGPSEGPAAENQSCTADNQCANGLVCRSGKCVSPPKSLPQPIFKEIAP